MFGAMVDLLFEAALRVSPFVVCALSARRLMRSRSFNAVLYAALCGYCLAAGLGMIVDPDGLLGHGSMLMASLALPIWLVLREVARRPVPPELSDMVPVFASSRRSG